jgi:murein DD-endopeptidase MepM/ murein hydrolase activator NlpD
MHTPDSDVAEEAAGVGSVAPAILSQDDPWLKGWMARIRSVPATARVGFLGVALLAVWWTWPQLNGAQHNPQAQVATLALAPTFTSTPVAQPPDSQPGALAQVVIPTATAASDAQAVADSAAAQPAVEAATQNVSELNAPSAAQPDTILLIDPVPTKVAVVLVPTKTSVTVPPTEEAVISSLPQVRILPAVGLKLPPTRTPVGNAVVRGPTPTPTPEPLPIDPGRLWSAFAPLPAAEADHFWVERPFLPSAANQLSSPSYQFGSSAGDRYRPHHGVDISNPMGTPVLAATEGEVVHAGMDDPELLGPYNNFYGNAVVIRLNRKLTVGEGELDVYLLYGHLSQVFAAVGQQVKPEDVVGAVGMTGIAIGPHLHVEMRLGANTYRHSVNPYLWLQPTDNNGAVAVRLLTADGRTWPGARLTLARFEGGAATWARVIETYLDTENIGPDPAWGENGAMEGVPPGYYVLVGVVNGESIRTELTVNPGQTSFVEIRTRQ